jgi:hypothetical protein
VHEGVTLHMYPTTAAPVSIELGTTTVQDLILDLGRPAQVFYKTDERMKIHSESSSGPETEADCECVAVFCNAHAHLTGLRFLQLLPIWD